MTRFYLCTALLVAIVATYSSSSTVATPLEATDAGDEFLAELDQVEDSGKKPRVDRELNHWEWWHHDDDDHYWHPPTKRPTERPTKKPWGWKPPTKKPTKKPWGWNY